MTAHWIDWRAAWLRPSRSSLCAISSRWEKTFCLENLGITEAQLADPRFNMLKVLGFTQEELAAANDYCCGTMTIEEAPHLKPNTCQSLIVPTAVAGSGSAILPSKPIFA